MGFKQSKYNFRRKKSIGRKKYIYLSIVKYDITKKHSWNWIIYIFCGIFIRKYVHKKWENESRYIIILVEGSSLSSIEISGFLSFMNIFFSFMNNTTFSLMYINTKYKKTLKKPKNHNTKIQITKTNNRSM